MSLSESTTKLQNILNTINQLPESGGSGSSVQEHHDTIMFYDNEASIELGFVPDFLTITLYEEDEGYIMSASADFSLGDGLDIALWANDADIAIDMYIYRSQNNININAFSYDSEWNLNNPTGTFTYKAYKFT